jgi:hypothetical protein
MSCKNSGQKNSDTVTSSDAVIKSTCNTLLDSILHNDNSVVNIFFDDYMIRENGIHLSDALKMVLFSDTEIQKQIMESDCYLYGIVKSSDNIYSIVISLTNIIEDEVYIINMNCDLQLTDYLRFDYCNYFDAYIPKNQNFEHAYFWRKYFKYSNDTMFITSHVNREEKKEFTEVDPYEKIIDSLTFYYSINKRGEFNLDSKDSIRVLDYRRATLNDH